MGWMRTRDFPYCGLNAGKSGTSLMKIGFSFKRRMGSIDGIKTMEAAEMFPAWTDEKSIPPMPISV